MKDIVQPYASASQAILDKLEAVGINALWLMQEWGVILWSVRVKEGEVKLKLNALGRVDECALERVFQQALGPELKVRLKFKPLSKCCHSVCEGCLYGNEAKRDEWIGAVLTSNPG